MDKEQKRKFKLTVIKLKTTLELVSKYDWTWDKASVYSQHNAERHFGASPKDEPQLFKIGDHVNYTKELDYWYYYKKFSQSGTIDGVKKCSIRCNQWRYQIMPVNGVHGAKLGERNKVWRYYGDVKKIKTTKTKT